MLARDTDWRQGDLLTPEAAAALGLVELAEKMRRVIVITHDCDLAHDGEPFVEVIVAEIVPVADANFSYAKHPRRLHLVFELSDGTILVLDLQHVDRHPVPADDFVRHAVQDDSVRLTDREKRTFKQWLAARYGRPAFPNAFEVRLRKSAGKRTVKEQIAKILEPEAKHLLGLFFDLGEQRGFEATDGEAYALSISVVYDATEGAAEARRAAECVAGQLHHLFDHAFGTPGVATEIALDACEAVADTRMTLADLRRVDQWRLEHISLRDDGRGDFLPVGEIPA